MSKRDEWGGRLGIILAVTGSAVGLGNFLRFPGLAAKYGGGTFMIPYLIAFLILGLPVAYVEWSLARYGGQRGFHSAPGIFSVLWPKKISPYLGVLGLIVPVGIYMYYVFIEAWCLYYAWGFISGALQLGTDITQYKSFFESFTGSSANGVLFQSASPALIALVLCYLLNFFFVYRGIAGIERISRWGMPLLLVIALVVLVRVMTLGTPDAAYPERNVINGLGHLWNPPATGVLTSPANAQLWMDAAGQIFFSLSVGFGVIINYASYLSRKDDIMRSATTAAAGNEFAEVALGGLITVPAAFVFLGAAGIGSTFGLGFVSLPAVFAHMPFGQIFGALWFFLLFVAAITSSVSMIQPGMAFLEEGLHLKRKHSTLLLCGITLLGSLFVVYYSGNLEALDTMDFWVGTFFIFVLALSQVLIGGWLFGVENIIKEARQGAHMRIPKFLPVMIKYITPAFLGVVFILWCIQKLPEQWTKIQTNPVTQISILFLLGVCILFLIMTHFAVKRWNKTPPKGDFP
ncbi:MAG TPA: sodium-dependent transporter [Turneriella sp.]|nr:sodium-dependent transporter [Turneriella sp.]